MKKCVKMLAMGAWMLLVASSCAEEKKGYTIEGEVADVKEGMMYLKKYEAKTFVDVDSAVIPTASSVSKEWHRNRWLMG